MATEAALSVSRGLEQLRPLSDQCCIYKVPEILREMNEKAYTPRVVSIGPLHHGLPNLEAMEEHKLRYLKYFLDHRTKKSLEQFVKLIERKEARVRDCYADSIKFNPVDFIKMILMDAVFIIELFLRATYGRPSSHIDRIFLKPQLVHDIELDLCMLENQLPFFIIKDLFNLADIEVRLANIRVESPSRVETLSRVETPSLFDFSCNFFKLRCFNRRVEAPSCVSTPFKTPPESPSRAEKPSLFDLTYNFFKGRHRTSEIKGLLQNSFQGVKHLLHFITFCYRPEGTLTVPLTSTSLDITLCCQPLPSTSHLRGTKTETLTIPSIKELHQAGIKFKLGLSKNRYEIKFNNGELELPKIEIYDTATELRLRNIVALERCESNGYYVADYVDVLKRLLNAPEDVELLVREGIVENWLEDGKAVSTLFQNISKGVIVSYDDFHYTSLIEDLNKYYNSSWHKWKANLKQNYFNTPWAALSVFAAVVLLILTVIQTVCSIIQFR